MVEDIEITSLKEFIRIVKDQYHYDFSNYATSSLKRRLVRIMNMFQYKDFNDLLSKITKEPEFFKQILTEITVNVTELFRDPSMWRELRDKIFPSIFTVNNEIKIWHAGCSSGEEVYSICILLSELGLLDKVKILATDIDFLIIEKAKSGRFLMKTIEDVGDKNYIRYEGKRKMSDYYTIDGAYVQMDKKLLRNVIFKEHDLVKSGSPGKFDMIFCRNVMIYFNQVLQNDVLKMFHESLFSYGYLTIGSKESIIWCDVVNKFITVSREEKIFKKISE